MTQKIIILAGCDMTGKTQIAHELARRLNIPYFKASSEHEAFLTSRNESRSELFLNQLRYADPRMLDFLKQTGHSVVKDRAFPCEYVYSGVFKRMTDYQMLCHIDEQYAKLGTKIVVTSRSSYEGIVDDLDPTLDSKILQKIDYGYIEFMSWTKCDIMRLNVDDEDLNREVTDVLNWLNY